MAAPYSAIGTKAEEAVRAVIIAAVTGIADAQVFVSFQSGGSTVMSTHSVAITSEGAIEDGHNSGNWRMSVRVEVMSNLDQSVEGEGGTEAATHREYAGKVFDALSVDSATLAASLSSAVTDFFVQDSISIRHGRQRVENRKAISEMMLEFSAIPSDV